MAISRKTNDAPKGVNLDKLPDLAKRIDARKQKLDDARMDHAEAWEEPKNLGFNIPPLKQALKLRDMEPEKRSAWLTDFYEYCRKLAVYAQPGLFEGDATERAAEEAAGATTNGHDADTVSEARTAGLKDGAEGKSNFDQYEEGSPAHLAYKAAWDESQAAAVSGMGEKPNGRSRRGAETHGHA